MLKCFRTSKIALSFFLFSTPLFALQLSGELSPSEGDQVFRAGVTYIGGLISPPNTSAHPTGFNKASLTEEYLSFSLGFGDSLLKDFVMETRFAFYQVNSERLNGVEIHSSDRGFIPSLKFSGNFVHELKYTLGTWLQFDLPLGMEKRKFVKPNVNYWGVGLMGSVELLKQFHFFQTLFWGSGLFMPRTKNANIITNSLLSLNFGQLLFKHDISLKSGLSVESDLRDRTDSAYQASSLNNGEIKNFVLITPLILNVGIVDDVSLRFSTAMKWSGRSVRGDKFYNAELSTRF